MRRLRIAPLLAVAVLALAVIPAASAHGVGPAGVSVHQTPFDEQFIDMMAAHHMMAIEMAQMAMKRAKHPELRLMARKIITAQSKEIAEFHALRKQWYGSATFIRYPMDEMMMRSMGMGPNMMKGLMMTGRFDYAFLSDMIPHHAGAITMARWETQVGSHLVLRRIAKKIIRDQGMEIGEMMQMRMNWFGR